MVGSNELALFISNALFLKLDSRPPQLNGGLLTSIGDLSIVHARYTLALTVPLLWADYELKSGQSQGRTALTCPVEITDCSSAPPAVRLILHGFLGDADYS